MLAYSYNEIDPMVVYTQKQYTNAILNIHSDYIFGIPIYSIEYSISSAFLIDWLLGLGYTELKTQSYIS